MILVTGATGQFGKTTIDFLLKKDIPANNIAALVRDEAKAADLKSKGIILKTGDYNNYESLLAAFADADKLLFVSGNEIENRVSQHENVVKAAIQAGVKHVVYTSFLSANESNTSPIAMVGEAHIQTEKWLKESGLSYTILKNNIYMDMIPVFIGEKALETGIIYQPAGEGKCAYVLREEMAEIAANILTSTGHEGKIYPLTGNKAYSYGDIAKILSEITGKDIQYVSPTPEEFSKTLQEANVPAAYIGMLTGFSVAKAQGEFDIEDNTMEILLGRKPTSVTGYLKKMYATNELIS